MRAQQLGACMALLAVACEAPIAPPRQVVAHRGFAAIAPENTLAAIEAAFEAGADAAEVDVRITLDGVPVLLHDDTLDRTTDGTGPVESLPWDVVQTLDAGSWKDARFAGERVPTLDEALALARGRLRLQLDLKINARLEEHMGVVADLVRKHDMVWDVEAVSRSRTYLQRLVRMVPEIRTGLIVDRAPLPGDLKGGHAFISIDARKLDDLVAARIRASGKEVAVFGADDGRSLSVAAKRADMLVTDRPDLALRIVEKMTELPRR